MDKDVLFYTNNMNNITCKLCPHECTLNEGSYGFCKVRHVKNGILKAENYGDVTSFGVDPIEKKPLYHFKPSKNILSLGSYGCNMTCSFCQNYNISQNKPHTKFITLDALSESLNKAYNNCGIAFTYNEPFMWYEYVYDALKYLKEQKPDISTVLVTNGYVNSEPLLKLLPYVDAMNIDLKGYSEQYYHKLCSADLQPVLENIKTASQMCHIEITTLLVTGENDSLDEVNNIAKFISSINEDIPLHLSRYFPRYKMNNESTNIEFMKSAKKQAEKHLKYVYLGNIDNIDSNTYCPHCNTLLIERNAYSTKVFISDDHCPACNEKINLIL